MNSPRRYLPALYLVPLMMLLVGEVSAQEQPIWGSEVKFQNGVHVQTGMGTVPASSDEIALSTQSVEVGKANTVAGDAFRRILKLSDGTAIIYEVSVSKLEGGRQFAVELRRVTPTPEEARRWRVNPQHVHTSFLGNYASPLTVNDGETLALDVLVNPRTGVRIVDYFLISNKPLELKPRSDHQSLRVDARRLTANDIRFSLENFEIRHNGEVLFSTVGRISGRFIWIDIPQVGRFIFSLVPRSESEDFYPNAYINGSEIAFRGATGHYEVLSSRPILSASGVFKVWMRFDPDFTPPVSSFQPSRYTGDPGKYVVGATDELNYKPNHE